MLVTGGSRGIGLALARGFAARGHDLILAARGAGQLEAAAADIRAEYGVSVAPLPCDLARSEVASGLLAAIDGAGCYVDILVNCAGVGASGPFVANSAADNHAALDLNVKAATRLMQACLPGMLARKRGGVLNVASLAGMLAMPHLAVYGASKSYLVALSRAVASEVGGSGVTVSVLLPGPVDTSFFAGSLQASEQSTGLLPALSAATVAQVAIEGFLAGQRVVTPGMLGSLCRLGLKLLPHRPLTLLVKSVLGRAPDGEGAAPRTAVRPDAKAPTPTPPGHGLWQLVARNGHRLVLLGVAFAFLLQVSAALRKAPPVAGNPGSYIAAAAGILEHGMFADAFVPGSPDPPAPGRYLAPGYPAFIALAGILDPQVATALECPAARWADCAPKSAFISLFAMQALAGLATLAFAYFIARALSGSTGLAALATLLTFIMGRFTEFAGLIMPYAILPALALGLCLALVTTHMRRSIALAALSGLLVGVLALVEIYYAALWLLAPVLLLGAERSRAQPGWRFASRAAGMLVLTAGLVIGPWMARNFVLFGDARLTDGMETKHFAERVAYNAVGGRDMLVGAFFWLPAIGDLSGLFLPRAATVKFDVYYHGSLLMEAPRILAAHSGTDEIGPFARLVRIYVSGDPGGYAMSTALLIERGMRATGGLFVLWGWLALPLLLRRLAAQGYLGLFLLVAGPLIGIAVVQAFLTANLPWMNQALLFVYAYAIVRVTGGLELPLRLRRHLSRQQPPAGQDRPGAPVALRPRFPLSDGAKMDAERPRPL